MVGLATAVVCAFFGARQLARPTNDAAVPPRSAGGDIQLPRSANTSFRILHETVRARVYTPDLQELEPEMISAGRLGSASIVDRANSTAGTSGNAVRVTKPDAPDRAVGIPSSLLGGAPPPPAVALVSELSPSTAAELPRVSPAMAEPMPGARPAPAALDQRRLVLDVLKQYERAYDNLDAAGAYAVWPTVNRDALAKAFAGLTSQSVSLSRCDVMVSGDTAQADCTGTARWTPRVGNAQVQSRRWSFRLKSAEEGWTIVSATVR